MQKTLIDNDVYFLLNEEWYTADDHPIALLRAEQKVKNVWVEKKMKELLPQHQPSANVSPHFPHSPLSSLSLLDVGCGAGFLSNSMANVVGKVTGIDQSEQCLKVAQKYDKTGQVKYLKADAYHLPFPDQSFDIVTAMDFLEHVDEPERVISEISRVSKKGALFFFHTFNRNFISNLIAIKLVESLFKEKARNMHVKELFITPKELSSMCNRQQFFIDDMVGLRPKINWGLFVSLINKKVHPSFEFKLGKNLQISYMGVATKG